MNQSNPSNKKQRKGSVTIQAPADKRAKSSGPGKETDAPSGFVYVRKDRKQDGEQAVPKEELKTKKQRETKQREPRPSAPPIFSEEVEGCEEINKMRQAAKKVWNQIAAL